MEGHNDVVEDDSTSPPLSVTSPTRRQQIHAAARLQLAAALLEYDYEQDGKLAEHSAIFAPYREEPPDFSPSTAQQQYAIDDTDNEVQLTFTQQYGQNEFQQSTPLDHDQNQNHDERLSSRHSAVHRRSTFYNDSTSPELTTTGYGHPYATAFKDNTAASRANVDFASPRAADLHVLSPESVSSSSAAAAAAANLSPDPLLDDVDDADLASEWGLDNVVSKFDSLDSNAFRMEASKMKAAAAAAEAAAKTNKQSGSSGKKRKTGRKRSGTSGSDILFREFGTMNSLDAGLKLQQDLEQQEEELNDDDPTFGVDSHSAPTVLNANINSYRKLRARSGSYTKEARKSFESQLEMAFSPDASEPGGGENHEEEEEAEGEGHESHQQGGRSRASSLGGFANSVYPATSAEAKDEAIKAVADYAAETSARPPSSLAGASAGGFVSRFDPKALAAQREEELATRPRFPYALHPKILIMPAPLAELEAEAQAIKQAEEEEANANATKVDKPHIEREPGKLFGKSLMDELQQRKERQKARNRAFRGDSRKAMMDMQKFRRAPSPLAVPGQEKAGGHGNGSDEDDDDDRPLRPASSAPVSNDPWLKYTSHRSLAQLSKDKSSLAVTSPSKEDMKRSPTTPTMHSPGLNAPSPGFDTNRNTLSTAELQQVYKKNRQSMLDLNAIATQEESTTDDDDDEDDDVPLVTRQEQLATTQKAKDEAVAAEEKKPVITSKVKEAQSVFGIDLVMQKELAKLEQILEIEAAERKIQAERQRIKDAEREAKEAKKKAKIEKKEKKRKEKERIKAIATGKIANGNKQASQRQQVDDGEMQWIAENRTSVLGALNVPPQERTRSMSPAHDEPYQRQSYFSMAPKGEEDNYFGQEKGRDSLLPDNEEDGALTPRPVHARSSSFAPSLTLPFLAGDVGTPDAGPVGGLGWFGDDHDKRAKQAGDNNSDDGAGSDGEERIRCKSPFGIDTFASDDEERVNATAIWNEGKKEEESRMREIQYDPSKKPELQRMSVADSFAGVLEGFGLGDNDKVEGTGSDDEGDGRKSNRKSMSSKRIYVHRDANSNSDDEDDGRPLSMILLGEKRPQTGHKLTLDPPRLGLPMDFAMGDKEDSDSEEEDGAPLAFKRFNASRTAGAGATAGRTYDNDDADEEDDDSGEDDIPLAAKQEDDKPLGQAHPVAALTQQMELQQQQNAALMAHMQLQYQYALQMQLQQAIVQQADIIGYTPSQVGYVPPAAALSGAASDIGVDLGPDPKLVNSVDRWRQGVQ